MRRLAFVFAVLAGCGGDDGDGGGDGDGGTGTQDGGGTDGVPVVIDAPPGGSPGSLRFYNRASQSPGGDRVEIRIDPQVPADVGAGSFTIDFWYRLGVGVQLPAETMCQTGRDGWKSGHIVLDRDRSADGPHGEFGLSLFRNRIAFGISQGTAGVGICGAPGSGTIGTGWHHVAVTRDVGTRQVTLYLDGVNIGSAMGPAGDVSYQDGSTGAAKDPFLVIGAEKHDTAGANGLDGFVDELRISTVVRYTADFTPATMPHVMDADTAALYHFDDGGGMALSDTRGMSPGEVKFGTDENGAPVPIWSVSEPWPN